MDIIIICPSQGYSHHIFLSAKGCRITYENHENNPIPSFYMTIKKATVNLFDLSTGNINLKIIF